VSPGRRCSTTRAAVEFVDRRSKRSYEVQARVVVVGASTLESTHILLNSATRQHANGLANSSEVLGRYLFDHFYVKGTVQAIVPELRNKTITRGMTGGGGLVVRFRNLKERDKRYVRGYAMGFGAGGTPDPNVFPLYGSALEDAMREHRNTSFGLTTMGEVLPRRENFVEIDKTTTDAWGIPVLRIHHVYSENERAMAKDAMEMGEQMCRNAGFEVLAKHDQPVPPGESIHELGTCRMGADPKTSVLNSFQQAHDIKNLFVVDGSSFVSAGSQNPTLSMVALALRSSEYLAEAVRKGNI
jgi:choline dehydrogenase-like flavoprotein